MLPYQVIRNAKQTKITDGNRGIYEGRIQASAGFNDLHNMV